MSDPRGTGTVSVELNHTLAQLLARLCVELAPGDDDAADPGAVMSRALGLLDLAMQTRRQGGRLCFVNGRGELSDVVF
jgi:hypothetical protein